MSMQEFSWDAFPVKVGTTTPAVGADFNLTVPAGKRWLFLGWAGVLVTDANVANRLVYVQCTADGTNIVFQSNTTNNHAASLTHYYYFYVSHPVAEVFTTPYHRFGYGLSNAIELPAAASINVVIGSKQAGDDWGSGANAIYYLYKEAPA